MASSKVYGYAPQVLKRVDQKHKRRVKFVDVSGKAKVDETLPFRVKFINIGINLYNSSNPAPIGIAVIGLNNYVL